MAENNDPKLIPLPERKAGKALQAASSGIRPREKRRRILAASYALCVLIPVLVGALYFTLLASDRYVSGAGFTVRGINASVGGDFIGAVTGLASTGSTTSDSYILLHFLKSRDLVERLEQELPFRAIYAESSGADFLSRLDPTLDIEHVVEYWDQRIHTAFDSTSGIITFQIEAFAPTDAQRLAASVLTHARELVNELSSQARQDSVAYAEAEVKRAETRLTKALGALRQFREGQNALDPAGAARIELELVGELEKQLAEVRARIATLKGSVDADSPSMRNLGRQADALDKQIKERRNAIGTGDGTVDAQRTALTGQLAEYETLEVERNFAQQAYTSALASLEKARVEADRRQRYLAVYSSPAVPQYPLYPQRLLNCFLLFSGLSLIWGIGVLIVYSVRDHIS